MDAASGTCFNESEKIAVAFSENIPYRLEACKSLLGPTADLLHQFERQINVYICVYIGNTDVSGPVDLSQKEKQQLMMVHTFHSSAIRPVHQYPHGNSPCIKLRILFP